ncbi:sodium- and chloride-dependent glycine transporter 1-like isoform X2 [Branchiostoma lanceolatum]
MESNGDINIKDMKMREASIPLSVQDEEEEEEEFRDEVAANRGQWGAKLDFMLSMLGYCVGLGNVWRFPYLCYRNGGGAFLIPYLLFLTFAGIPLFMMEMSFGQYGSLGPLTIWRACPIFKGIGYGMVVVSGLVCIYYNVIIAWTLHFLFSSFTSALPWATCDNAWNTENCTLAANHSALEENVTRISPTQEYWKYVNLLLVCVRVFVCTCVCVNCTLAANHSALEENVTRISPTQEYWKYENLLLVCVRVFVCTCVCVNCTLAANHSALEENVTRISPTQEYWNNRVLGISSGIEETGTVQWELALCLLAAWVVVFFCLFKGIKSSGKVVYFTATFPYMMLIVLFVRGVTLEGAGKGLVYYLTPDFSRLADSQVWYDAASQIFYSLGIAFGGTQVMASYNKFNNNTHRDSVFIALTNCCTSVFAGVVVFSILGHMAHKLDMDVKDVVANGPGLVFVAYPEALTLLPVAPLWSVLFFFMIFTVGLDTQFVMLETCITGICDEFPHIMQKYKTWVLLAVSVGMYLLGLTCVTNAGMYWLNLMDWYSAGFSLMVLAFFMCIAISWVYGFQRFCKNVQEMIGYQPNYYFKICWAVISPMVLLFIVVFSMVVHVPAYYGSYQYPGWAVCIGWLMALMSIVMVPLFVVLAILKAKGSFMERLRYACESSDNWGPALMNASSAESSQSDEDEQEKKVPLRDTEGNDNSYISTI